MKNKIPLFIVKYSVICLILFAAGLAGNAFSLISLGFFYCYLALVVVLEPEKGGRDRKLDMIYSGIFVVFLSICLIVLLHILTSGLKFAVSLYEYNVLPLALYAAVSAGVIREFGRLSFMEKNWRYLFPGLLVIISCSTAVFIPKLAGADLYFSLGLMLLTFILGFVTSFKIVQKLISDY